MMGGVVIDPSCRTSVEVLFVAGEDAGGVHGANRLGGNGVANSTVFGGIAGDTMARWAVRERDLAAPDMSAIETAIDRAEAFFARRDPSGDVESIRERLYEAMWHDAGIVRDASSLARVEVELVALSAALDDYAPPPSCRERGFNLLWLHW